MSALRISHQARAPAAQPSGAGTGRPDMTKDGGAFALALSSAGEAPKQGSSPSDGNTADSSNGSPVPNKRAERQAKASDAAAALVAQVSPVVSDGTPLLSGGDDATGAASVAPAGGSARTVQLEHEGEIGSSTLAHSPIGQFSSVSTPLSGSWQGSAGDSNSNTQPVAGTDIALPLTAMAPAAWQEVGVSSGLPSDAAAPMTAAGPDGPLTSIVGGLASDPGLVTTVVEAGASPPGSSPTPSSPHDLAAAQGLPSAFAGLSQALSVTMSAQSEPDNNGFGEGERSRSAPTFSAPAATDADATAALTATPSLAPPVSAAPLASGIADQVSGHLIRLISSGSRVPTAADTTATTGLAVNGDTMALAVAPSFAQAVSAAPLAAGGVADQIAGHLIRLVSSGSSDMVMRLHPPELGDVTVRVALNGRDVSAWFASPQPEVQNAISAAIGQLQTDLGNAGYNLNGAWVGADASSAQQQRSRLPQVPPARMPAAASSAIVPAAAASHPTASGLNIYV